MTEREAAEPLSLLVELSGRLAACRDLDSMLSCALRSLDELAGISHSLVMVPTDGSRLVTLASYGYPEDGVGSEVEIGHGPIGVAARRRVPVRIAQLGSSLLMAQAARRRAGEPDPKEISLPGLPNSQCQMAIPVLAHGALQAVLFVEDPRPCRFVHSDEQRLQIVAFHLGTALALISPGEEREREAAVPARSDGAPILVEIYLEDDSVFFDREYIIKSLPGRILHKLLREHASDGRAEWTNKELRLDASLGLPAIKDNLETRLILLKRRLAERGAWIRLVRTGRGRFAIEANRPYVLRVHALP